jgi:hypothetical protein
MKAPISSLVQSPMPVYAAGFGLGVGSGALVLLLILGVLSL